MKEFAQKPDKNPKDFHQRLKLIISIKILTKWLKPSAVLFVILKLLILMSHGSFLL